MQELELITQEAPGIASLENFDEIKAYLEERLEAYRNLVYTEAQLKDAEADKKTLSKLKKTIDEKRKELKRIYMAPYLEAEAKIKELIAMIDEPLALITGFVNDFKDKQKEVKRAEIKAYFDRISAGLGEYADALFESPFFFEDRWLNKTCRESVWQPELREKIKQATVELQNIRAVGGQNTVALLQKYIETMDFEAVKVYQKSLQSVSAIAESTEITDIEDEEKTLGYKVLKLTGTRRQMAQILEQLDLLGIDFEELEDGMPKDFAQINFPDFDSFVAFDIETTGTYGAAYGDAPAEITEIGAVKVINGEIVARFDELCNPGRKITSRVERLTHITNEIVADKPPVAEVIRAFADFVGDLPLVGHNIKSSDLHYISTAAHRAGVGMENSFFDTLIYARTHKQAQGWDKLNLGTLAAHFGIALSDAHRAWCDAEANAYIYLKLKEL